MSNPAFVNGEKDSDAKPRSSSFKDSDKYVRTGSGTFVRQVSQIKRLKTCDIDILYLMIMHIRNFIFGLAILGIQTRASTLYVFL